MSEQITFSLTDRGDNITIRLNENARGPAGAAGTTTWSGLTGEANHIPFDTTPTSVPTTLGTLSWNADDACLEYAVTGGTISIGKETFDYYTNLSGVTMVDGDIVSIVGATGNRTAVDLTDATDATSAANVIGMVTQGAANNGTVRVTKTGSVHSLNTNGRTEGGTIYVDPADPGKWTMTRPTSPNHVVSIGVVQVAHSVNGVVDVVPNHQCIVSADITDASATGRTVLTGTATQARAAISAAQAIETKTANFTASIGGRYIVETGGTVSITDPTGTTAGDSYEVWAGSGSIQFNGTGTSYTASRFSIRRRYTGSEWATPAPMLSDTLTVGSGTWSGTTITGAQTMSGQLQLTGQSATDANSAMTRGLADTRYGSIVVMRLASDFDITSASLADVTGMSLSLEANTIYEVTGLLYVSAAGTSSRVQHQFAYSGTFQTMPGAIASNSTSGTYFFGGPTSYGFADANNTTVPFQMAGIIRTSNAGTLKLQNYRISGSGTPKLLAGSQIVLRKIP